MKATMHHVSKGEKGRDDKKSKQRKPSTKSNPGRMRKINKDRDFSKYIKWPKNVQIQRNRSIIQKRLKIPPAINQFSYVLPHNIYKNVETLFKSHPIETKRGKKTRLRIAAAAVANGQALERTPKPVMIKYGINHVTALIEKQKPSIVLIARDVHPIELILWIPALCRKMNIPYGIVKSKSRLGDLVNKKKATAICLTGVKPEKEGLLSMVTKQISDLYNKKKYAKAHLEWGGDIHNVRKRKLAKKNTDVSK